MACLPVLCLSGALFNLVSHALKSYASDVQMSCGAGYPSWRAACLVHPCMAYYYNNSVCLQAGHLAYKSHVC